MKRKPFIPLLSLILILFMYAPVLASDSSTTRIYDYAEILTESQESSLQATLSSLSMKYDFDIVVVTAADTEGYPGQDYADGFYEAFVSYYGMKPDGILLLWVQSTSEAFISTSGYGTYAFTDAGMSYLLDQMSSSLRSHDYASAFGIFAEKSGELVQMARDGNRMTSKPSAAKKERNPVLGAIGSLLAGFLPAGILTGSWKNRLKSVQQRAGARGYAVEGSFAVKQEKDTFLYNNVTRTKKENGTTVHKSGSGQVHGGASRKF